MRSRRRGRKGKIDTDSDTDPDEKSELKKQRITDNLPWHQGLVNEAPLWLAQIV